MNRAVLLLLLPLFQDPGYAALFDDTKVHEIHVAIDSASFDKLDRAPFKYYKADVEVDGEVLPESGIRHKGNSSMRIPGIKKPFKIDFEEFTKDRRYKGLRQISLNNNFKDPTMIREKLAYDLFRAAGCPASRCGHAALHLTLKGSEKQFMGLYTMVEPVDDPFLDERFGGHAGNLYKIEGMNDIFGRVDEKMIHDKHVVELKTNQDKDDRSRLVDFVRAVAEGRDDIGKWFDVESFIKWLAVNTALVNIDSYSGTAHNCYLYDDPKTGKFVFIPWDLNEAFGNFQRGSPQDMLDWDIMAPMNGRRALIERVLADEKYRETYRKTLRDLCTGPFSPAEMAKSINKAYRMTHATAVKDTNKFFSTATLIESIEKDVDTKTARIFGLKSFVERRCASILEQLDGKRAGRALGQK